MTNPSPRAGSPFPVTQWSLVAQAQGDCSTVKRQAVSQLLERYLPAIHSHLMYRKRMTADQADDIAQGFITSKVLEKDLIGKIDQQRGKFRTLLLTALDRYVIDQQRAASSKIRRLRPTVCVDDWSQVDAHGSGSVLSAGGPFDVEWARGLIDQALTRMRQECLSTGHEDVWAVFEYRLLKPIFEHARPPSYKEMVSQYGFESPTHASNRLVSAKRMFARHLRAAVSDYVVEEQDIEEELNDLMRILANKYS